jgi:hypothetical protein
MRIVIKHVDGRDHLLVSCLRLDFPPNMNYFLGVMIVKMTGRQAFQDLNILCLVYSTWNVTEIIALLPGGSLAEKFTF